MDMPADPSGWACKRADELMQVERPISFHRAFARYIEAHEQPPVDPDLVTAREICAVVAEGLGNPVVAHGYRKGSNDTGERVQFALAKLKEARGSGSVSEVGRG